MTKNIIILLAIILPALFIGLGDRPIAKIQEVRIAETAREMVASSNWLVPYYNGELRLQKPPLPYWLTAVSYHLFGVNETASRLPSAVFALMTIVLLFLWTTKKTNLATGTTTALVFATSFISLRYFRSCEADTLLTLFITTASLSAYYMLYEKITNAERIVFFAALGLGFLTKGPAAIAIPVITIFAVAVVQKRLFTAKPLLYPQGWAIFFVLAFGWYAWLLWRMPDAAAHFMGRQVDETFISGTHVKPVWFYLQHSIDYFLPWSFFLVPAGIWTYKNRPLAAPLQFAWIWLAVVFVLLTLTVNKQMQYALLFAPPFAIIIGYYLNFAKDSFVKFNHILLLILCMTTLVAGAAMAKKVDGGLLVYLPLFLAVLIQLFFKKILQVNSLTYPPILLASLMVAASLYFEKNEIRKGDKDDVRVLMIQASQYQPLYQLLPGSGAVSFYAGKVVPAVKNEKLHELAKSQSVIWMIADNKTTVEMAGLSVTAEITGTSLSLWKVTGAK